MSKQNNVVKSLQLGRTPSGIGLDLTDRERGFLALLRQEGPSSRAALIKSSGLSGPAVFRTTEDLAAKGFINIGPAIAAGRGQPSNEVRLNAFAAFSLGVSVTNDFAEVAMMDLTGRIIATQDITTPNMSLDLTLDAIEAFLQARVGMEYKDSVFAGIGLAVAGFFIGEGEKLNPVVPLDDWALVELGPIFEARFNVPVYVENIASAAAVGESLVGIGHKFKSFGYVNFAFGFGGGIILDGKLWRGKSGNAGEIGAILNPIGAFFPSLESLRLEVNRHGGDINSIRQLLIELEGPSDRFEEAVEVWIEKAATSIALLAYLINACVDVEALALGGRLPSILRERLARRASEAQELYNPPVRRERSRPSIAIVPAQVSDRAAVVGGAALPLTKRIFRPVTNLLS